MQSQYVVSQLRVICGLAYCASCQDIVPNDLIDDPIHTWLLSRVWVPRKMRGRRYGRIALDRVCHAADAEGSTLVLSVVPDDDSPLAYEDTVSFYERHGFVMLEGAYYGIMKRQPHVRE